MPETEDNSMDVKTASELASLIPQFDGTPSKTKSFVDAVLLTQSILPEVKHPTAIKLVLTKLTGKARDLFLATPSSLQEIATKIQINCVEKGSSDLALANLKNAKVNKGNIQLFTKEVDELCDKLAAAYIREAIPAEVAKKLSQKQAIQTLVKESTKPETKMMLKIGKFDSLSEAINILVENEPQNLQNPAQVLNIQRTNNRGRGGRNPQMRGNYRGRRQNHPNYNHQFTQRNNRGNNHQYYQNNFNRQHFHGGNNSRNGPRTFSSRVYYSNEISQSIEFHDGTQSENRNYQQHSRDFLEHGMQAGQCLQ